MKVKIVRGISGVAIVLALSLLSFAQSSQSQDSKSGSSKMSSSDQQFLKKAAQGGQAEVQLGQLAAEKSQDPKVKSFAQRMVTDHSKANDKLQSLASSKGITLPTGLDAKDQAEQKRLSKLSGEQFDKAYMNSMVKDHTKDVSEFQQESQSAKDPDVKAFASETLPTLQSHLKEAKSIAPKESAEANSGKSTKSNSGNSTSASNPPQQ